MEPIAFIPPLSRSSTLSLFNAGSETEGGDDKGDQRDQKRSLKVIIATEQLEILKKANYKLCIARKVNDIASIVWLASPQYMYQNSFEWSDNGFRAYAETVSGGESNREAISRGQECLLDKSGVMRPASGVPNPALDLSIKNDMGAAYLGVYATLTANGQQQDLKMSRSDLLVAGTAYLQPSNTVKVWFSTFAETGTGIGLDEAQRLEGGADEKGIWVEFKGADAKEVVGIKSIAYAGEPGKGVWSFAPSND